MPPPAPEELRTYAREDDHWLVAYCPLARGEAFDRPEIEEVVDRYDASPARVCLAWLLSKENVAIIPKASSEAHMRDNLAARELTEELTAEDVDLIDDTGERTRIIDREYAPWNR